MRWSLKMKRSAQPTFGPCLLTAGALLPPHLEQIPLQLRGALRGAICPVNLTALVKRWEIQTTSSTAHTVTSLVEELIAEKAVFGSLRPGTSIFTPAAYALAQKNAAHRFYAQNAYVE